MWNAAVREKGHGQKRKSRVWTALLPTLSIPVLALLLFLGLAGCGRQEPVFKIGLVAPFEGRQRAVGYDALYAARLAVRQANTDGEAKYKVALVALDDSGDPELARQAAASLAADPDVVAVLGHWLPETTAAARSLYEQAGLPLIVLGQPPLEPFGPEGLPATFTSAYEAVTPFEETAGVYAAPTYDALGMVLHALAFAEMQGQISRMNVADALDVLQYSGLTGTVEWQTD